MTQTPMRAPQLRLVGGFELTVGDRSVDLADPARRLIAFLALHRAAQPRAFVAESLWPDKPGARALANLRSALWTLHAGDDTSIVDALGTSLRLQPTVLVDVHGVQAGAWSLIEQARAAVGLTAEDVLGSQLVSDRELLFEDLLPGWCDDWALLERERFSEWQVHTLDALVPALTGAEFHSLAVLLALRLVAVDPLRERSQLTLIHAYLAEGGFGRAERQHRAFSELLQSSFGCGYERSFREVLVDAAGPATRP